MHRSQHLGLATEALRFLHASPCDRRLDGGENLGPRDAQPSGAAVGVSSVIRHHDARALHPNVAILDVAIFERSDVVVEHRAPARGVEHEHRDELETNRHPPRLDGFEHRALESLVRESSALPALCEAARFGATSSWRELMADADERTNDTPTPRPLHALDRKRHADEPEHCFMLLHDRFMRHAQHAVPEPLHVPVPPTVSRSALRVIPAVYFHDEPTSRRDEVRDVPTDDDLPAKPDAEPRPAERLPEPSFRERGRVTVRACVLSDERGA